MNPINNIQDLIASANQAQYNILRTTPTSAGCCMSHDDIKAVMNLSDGAAEGCRAQFAIEMERMR